MPNEFPNKPESISDLADRIAGLSAEKRALLELEVKKIGSRASAEPTIPRSANRNSVPLSFAQQRLWFLDQYEPNSSIYNVSSALRFEGRLETDALERSIEHIVRRHEALRTTFSAVDGQPVQIIAPALSISLPVVDLTERPEAEREDDMRRLAREEALRPFDLTRGPLFRTTLIRLEETDHVLLLTLHHIVSDGWSLGVLYRELAALYEAFSNGKQPSLEPLPVQYADFAVWQRGWLQGEVLESQLSYWTQQLDGAPAVLNLPTDRPRPALQSFRGERQSIELSHELAQGLKTLGRKEGVTLFMILLAAFQTLLHRYTRQDDIVVGSPIANRNRMEIEGLIGFFVNTLVLRGDLSGNPTFRQLLARVREVALGAYAHQDLPFEKLVEELRPDRSLSHTPLFQVMFALQHAPNTTREFKGLSTSPVRIAGETAKFDLTLLLYEEEHGLRASLHYNTDLFDNATITRMLGHFRTLLEGIAADPNQRISELPPLTESEKHQVLVQWNGTKREYPKDRCIHELFETQVEKSPDAVAVMFEAQQLTYRELNSRANQLAHYLQKLGVGPEVLVGICMERSLEMVVAVLAVLKAGGAYVPLDPEYPKERLRFMLEDTQALVLLTQNRLLTVLPQTSVDKESAAQSKIQSARVVCLDIDWENITEQSGENPRIGVTSANLAYVIYTSGSTGTPKGVGVPHLGVARLLFGVDYVRLDSSQTFLQLASPSFDASTFEIWGALLHGAKCVLYRGIVPTPAELGEVLHRNNVDTLWLTASLFNLVIDQAPAALGGIRQLLVGGESLSVPHVRRGLGLLPETEIINGYGPTESTTFACWYPIPRALDWSITSVSIGRPISNTQVYLLDPNLNPVPVGVSGELHIGGDGLARGYLNRPDFTAEKFIPNPFSSEPGARLYRTGDLARYLPDGNIEFLGRTDDQVKIRGFRIELGEIEAVLGQHPAVREAVVTARDDTPGHPSAALGPAKRLVAYVVLNREPACTLGDLRSFLRQKLPDYMVPSAFVFLEALPLTPNGKVDRRALPAPDQSRPKLEEVFVAPRNPMEEIVAGIWEKVLGIGKVGVHDNFFDLGGHSLKATQVVSRLREACQLDLPLRVLFETPTVAGLAARIEEIRRTKQGMQNLPLLPVSRDKNLPLSFAQQRLWFLDQLQPHSSVYNIPSALRLKGNLDIAALERSINEILKRHEGLRTVFACVDGEPIQRILPSSILPLPVVDLADRSQGERENEAQRLGGEEAGRPFDLTHGPLLRAALLRLGEEEHILLLTLHHIVSDGWSVGVLYRELSALYEAFLRNQPSPLPDLTIQYADFAVWQRNWLRGRVLEFQLSYWKKQLEDVSILRLPTDWPRPAVQSHEGGQQSLIFSHDLLEKLKALSRKEGVTLFITMLAAFQAFLHRYTGQNDIAVGTPIAGRSRSELEGLIGFFVNTLVMRADLSGEPTFRELLARVREVALGAYAHQDVPFEKLVEELHPQRNLSQAPLFQVMFAFQNTPREALGLKDLTVTTIRSDSATTKFDLSLSIREEAEGLNGTLRYNTNLFSAATIKRMTEHFRQLLQGLLENPDQPIGKLRLITSAERRQLVEVWSSASKADSEGSSGHRLIKEQEPPVRATRAAQYGKQPETLTQMIATWAQRTPDTVAMEAPGRAPLTYGQLVARVETVAAELQAFGLSHNDRVALVLPDGPESAVALLSAAAVATAAPLNPAYRPDEFEFYLTDLNARGLIVQAGEASPARAVAQARGIPILELLPKLDGAAGLFNLVEARNPSSGYVVPTGPQDVALILYTSGTTSRPKLVPLTHANLLASARNITAALAISRNDRCLNIMPLYHVHGIVGALLASLAAGASVVCTAGFYAPEFFSWLEAFRPTWYTAVPAMHQAILTRAEANQSTIGRCPLRFIRSSSAALPLQLMDQLENVFQVPIIESYGMTESAHQISSNPLPPARRKAGSVGVGAGPDVAIMDQLGNILSEGTSGEVVIRGANVCQEYGNDADANTAAFTEGWFHTGDQGYLDSDGYLFLTSRFKEIINRGGEKISPREVDEVLMDHPAVTQAVTFPVPHPSLGEEVAAAVVLRPHHTVTARELREFAAARLVDFKVPRQVVILDEIPSGPTGKVQRVGFANQLGITAIDQLTTEDTGIFEPPLPGTEELLAGIWAQILGLEHVGRHDNFFRLGGDSILAARTMNRVRTRLHAEVSFIDFFENPTVAGLAETIARKRHTAQTPETMRPLPRTGALPLSYAQQALWFLYQLNPDTWIQNRAVALRLTGSLDIGAMEESLNLVVNRHEALRTSFPILQDSPTQVIAPTQLLALRIVDLSAVPVPDREVEAKEVLGEEARRPFDLAQGPVLRSALVKLAKDDHILAVTLHHIASDGWSDTVLLRELATAYNAITVGLSPDFPSLRAQYVDFTAWQRETLQGAHLERLLVYWRQQMGTGLPRLKFPFAASHRTAATRRGARQVLNLPRPLSAALKNFSTNQEVTLFMTLLAAFKTLLYRYTGQEDLLVGTPIAGRNSEELEGVIGNFTNLLGLRTDLSGNPSFRALLDRVRRVTLQAYAHQDLPLGRLAEALRKEQGLDITFPFQVMFGLRNFPSPAVRLAGLKTAQIEFDDGIARFELSLDTVEKPEGIKCLFEYDCALFDRVTITRLMRHFQSLLEGIVADPDTTIDSLPLLDASERQAALKRSVTTTTRDDIEGLRGIHHLFEEQVARTPAATAVRYDGSGLSYAELNGRANQLAHHLRCLGVGPDTLVGICVERSLEMTVGLLGILKAGGAYVPLDPGYPKERLAFLLEDTKVGVVLTQQRLVSALPPRNARLVLLDTDWPKIAREAKQDPAGNSGADNLAYVIYTSGSTGKPKGVLITHGGVVNHGVAMARHFALRPEDRVAQCTSLSFDISVEELFPSWISGASVVLCPPAIFAPGTDLVRWLDYEQITAVNLPTTFWHEWVCDLERSHESIPRSLRLVVVGGEKASAEALVKWKRCAGTHARWINTYGPTEATVTTTIYGPSPDPIAASSLREIPIGQPITGSQVYVLDSHLNPVPIGVVGELYIGGAGLARGYRNHPELTSEKFIPNPFSTDPGARLYRTGDLTRYRSDGAIEFIGRIDSQVKIRGFRIEIGEIETVLSQHPSVHNNVVVVREDEFNGRRLIAYVVLNQGLSPENPDLRGFLLGKLPEYMVPSGFEIIAAFPLNANGKIDRRALPAPKGMRPDLKENFVPPRNKTEEKLAGIWSKFLGVKQVGIRDNFFVLGGHSLLAVRLFGEIEKEFKKRLPLSSLFKEATIEHLAGLIKQSGPLTSRSCVVAIQPRGTKPPFFCVHEFFGDVFCYINLARYLGSEQPFYALQARGLDGLEEPFTEIEAMAAYYIEQIRTVQPHGPYGLGGLCSGGVVAFEIAQQLLAKGESVSLLALLDSGVRPGPGGQNTRWGFLLDSLKDFPSWLIGSLQLNRAQWLTLMKMKLRLVKAGLQSSNRDDAPKFIRELGDLFQFSEGHRKVARAQYRALKQYRPRIYPGRLTLFRARMQPLFSAHRPDKGWGPHVGGGLDIRVVPGNHMGMLQEPHVQVLAEHLRACLDSAQTESVAANVLPPA